MYMMSICLTLSAIVLVASIEGSTIQTARNASSATRKCVCAVRGFVVVIRSAAILFNHMITSTQMTWRLSMKNQSLQATHFPCLLRSIFHSLALPTDIYLIIYITNWNSNSKLISFQLSDDKIANYNNWLINHVSNGQRSCYNWLASLSGLKSFWKYFIHSRPFPYHFSFFQCLCQVAFSIGVFLDFFSPDV